MLKENLELLRHLVVKIGVAHNLGDLWSETTTTKKVSILACVFVVFFFVLGHKSALIIKKSESCLIGRDEKHTNAEAKEKYQSP